MLTSDQFDRLVIPITDLYELYNQSIINDIARRLVKLDMTSTSAYQLQRLIESGKVFDNAIKEIAILTGRSEIELTRTFRKAGVQAMRFDDSIYKAAGLNPLPFGQSPAMLQALSINLIRTNNTMRNLTLTTALSGQQSFVASADLAFLQVSTGAMSYDQAIKAAVKDVAESGLQVIRFTGRNDAIGVAMRRTVLTGVGQLTGDLQIARAEEMGQDLVQTSAHIGARPSHELWQGEIFSRSGTDDKYPDFVEGTGFGTGGGLAGWNCRHSFYPFFKGISENAYSKAEKAQFMDKTVEFNGQKITVYEATQKQRYIERGIRNWKRQAGALEAGKLNNVYEISKVREWQARMRNFTKQTGLGRQYVREGGAISPKIKETVIKPVIKKPVFIDAKTIQEANDYAINELGLEYSDYKGADIRIANAWNKGLRDTFNDFPELKDVINSTGTTQGRYSKQVADALIKVRESDFADFYRKHGYSESSIEKLMKKKARKYAQRTPDKSFAYSVSNANSKLNGIFFTKKYKYDELLETVALNMKQGFLAKSNDELASMFSHEIGHQLDEVFKISRNPELTNYYIKLGREQKIKEGLSKYALKNKGEFIAESWAEYINSSNPREIAQTVGDMITKIIMESRR